MSDDEIGKEVSRPALFEIINSGCVIGGVSPERGAVGETLQLKRDSRKLFFNIMLNRAAPLGKLGTGWCGNDDKTSEIEMK